MPGREWLHTRWHGAVSAAAARSGVVFPANGSATRRIVSAITTHRAGRSKAIRQSELDEVQGIGAARKRALLNHFGSARGVKMAGLGDLEAAPGINKEIARRVYAHFHPGVAAGRGRIRASSRGDWSCGCGDVPLNAEDAEDAEEKNKSSRFSSKSSTHRPLWE